MRPIPIWVLRTLERKPAQGKAGLALALLLLGALAGCEGGWELGAYRTLAIAQTNYDAGYSAIVELHQRGLVSDAHFARAREISTRIYALGKNTTGLLARYQQVRDPALKKQIVAAVAELPGLVAQLLTLVQSVRDAESRGLGTDFGEQLDLRLHDIEQRLATIERFQIIPHVRQQHGAARMSIGREKIPPQIGRVHTPWATIRAVAVFEVHP